MGRGHKREEFYPRAGEEQKEKLEEMLRLRLLSPSPLLNPRRRQGGCKVKAGTLSLSLRATPSQASEMQEEEVAAAEKEVVVVVVEEEEEEEEKEAKEEEKGKREMR
ncbi:hypothetical protein D623_10031591 [Myotis brandtii]|uniref:Uncharacterized protein n=1 Tax=Myotis brandtii TaxID=109478 RepID=S7MH32_MYOBR|nr:hypothetical protein D623_10031591 [Myotis brandtii]